MAFAEPRPDRLRLRIFPQSPLGGGVPRLETITVSPRAGSGRARAVGPADVHDRGAGQASLQAGPDGRRCRRGAGRRRAPAMPSRHGHFDHLLPGDPGFRAVHLYGCARFALDVWEDYLGAPVDWHFARHFQRLELVALEAWPNAHMGYGYLEVGPAAAVGRTVGRLRARTST